MEKISLFKGMTREEQEVLVTCLDTWNRLYEKNKIRPVIWKMGSSEL